MSCKVLHSRVADPCAAESVNDKSIADVSDILSARNQDNFARQVWEICHWIEGLGEETHVAACGRRKVRETKLIVIMIFQPRLL